MGAVKITKRVSFGYFNSSQIFSLYNFQPWASLWLYNTQMMPPFLETINIADFIPVLNRSLENNKSLIYAGRWRNSTCQIFNKWNAVVCLRYSQSPSEKISWQQYCARLKKSKILLCFLHFYQQIWLFWAFNVMVKNKLRPLFYVSFLSCSDTHHIILSSIRGQTHKKLVSIC